LMMNPVPWLQMTNMISYQGLVRTFPKCKNNCCTLCAVSVERKRHISGRDFNVTIKLAIYAKAGHF
ncbi:hypothetical protein, partial [Raoultella ornithinolytica]|uniref:hypothetical protein n=1 Tax=Raoultella ornithinolytica TaxID=54291 RepID=UPI0039B47344